MEHICRVEAMTNEAKAKASTYEAKTKVKNFYTETKAKAYMFQGLGFIFGLEAKTRNEA